jgi:hypothetical protein
MKIKRLAIQAKKRVKKQIYKDTLRKLQKEAGDNVELYRFWKNRWIA